MKTMAAAERARRCTIYLLGIILCIVPFVDAFVSPIQPLSLRESTHTCHKFSASHAPARSPGLRMMYGVLDNKPQVIIPQYVLDNQRIDELTSKCKTRTLWDPVTRDSPEDWSAAMNVDMHQTCHSGGIALRKVYHESDRIVVVLYMKDTCSMCKVLQPLVQKVIDQYEEEGILHYVKLEVMKHTREASRVQLTSTPVLHFFKDGMLLKELKGLQSKKTMKETIDDLLVSHASPTVIRTGPQTDGQAYPAHWEKNLDQASGRDVEVNVLKRIGTNQSPRGGTSAFAEKEKEVGEGVVLGASDPTELNEKDEMDAEFVRVLNEQRKVSQVSEVSKKIVGRLADGENNLDYSNSNDIFGAYDAYEASVYIEDE